MDLKAGYVAIKSLLDLSDEASQQRKWSTPLPWCNLLSSQSLAAKIGCWWQTSGELIHLIQVLTIWWSIPGGPRVANSSDVNVRLLLSTIKVVKVALDCRQQFSSYVWLYQLPDSCNDYMMFCSIVGDKHKILLLPSQRNSGNNLSDFLTLLEFLIGLKKKTKKKLVIRSYLILQRCCFSQQTVNSSLCGGCNLH